MSSAEEKFASGLTVVCIILVLAIPVILYWAIKQESERNATFEQVGDNLQRKRLGNGWLYEKYGRYPFYVPDAVTNTPERQ